VKVVRLGWHPYFLGVAKAVSLRGDCRRSQVGAVLVEDRSHRIISTGYNGVAPGQAGCLSGECPRGLLSIGAHPRGGSYDNCIAKHAEANCVEWAQQELRGLTDRWLTMYITRTPCRGCTSLLVENSIRRAVFPYGIWWLD